VCVAVIGLQGTKPSCFQLSTPPLFYRAVTSLSFPQQFCKTLTVLPFTWRGCWIRFCTELVTPVHWCYLFTILQTLLYNKPYSIACDKDKCHFNQNLFYKNSGVHRKWARW
jgi:hypothetical protein